MSSDTRIKAGDRVRFSYGTRMVTGTVKEDRGPIGVKGRHLYLIAFLSEPDVGSSLQIELPADQLERAQGALPDKDT